MRSILLFATLVMAGLAESRAEDVLEGLPVETQYSKNIIRTFTTITTRNDDLLRRQAQITIPYNAYFASVSSAAKDPKAISSYSYLSVLYTANVKPNTLITFSTVVSGITITQNIPPYQPTEYCWLLPGNSQPTPAWFKNSDLVTGDLSAYASWGVVRSACEKTSSSSTSSSSSTTSSSSSSRSSSSSGSSSSDSSSKSSDSTILSTVPVTVVITQGSTTLTSTGLSTSTSVSAAPASTTSGSGGSGGGSSSGGGLSTGAKIGAGVGGALGGILLIALGFLLAWYLTHKKRTAAASAANAHSNDLSAAGGATAYAANENKSTYVPEPPQGNYRPPSELPAPFQPAGDPNGAQYVMGPGGTFIKKDEPYATSPTHVSPNTTGASTVGNQGAGTAPGYYGGGGQAFEVDGVQRHELGPR